MTNSKKAEKWCWLNSGKISPVFLIVFTTVVYSAQLQLYLPQQEITEVNTGSVEIVTDNSGGGVRVIAGKTGFKSNPGEPYLPWYSATVLLPPDADIENISAHLQKPEYRRIEGLWDVVPSPPLATRDPNGNVRKIWRKDRRIGKNDRDLDIYETGEFWPPEDKVRIVHNGKMYRWKLAEIAVPLARYNPVSDEIQELVRADVIVDVNSIASAAKKQSRSRNNGNLRGRSRVRKIAANFSAASENYDKEIESLDTGNGGDLNDVTVSSSGDVSTAAADKGTYVIITTSSIENNSTVLSDFVTHKRDIGYNVMVVNENDWGGGTGSLAYDNIRNWLQTNYITENILYVLLIGNPHPDNGGIPMKWYDDGSDPDMVPTDAFYWDLDDNGWDKYWEVIVGRIPYYGSIFDIDGILRKTINYEKSSLTQWRKNVMLPMVPLDDDTPAYQCGEQIKSDHLDPLEIASARIYESNYGLNPPPEYLLANRYPAYEWADNKYGVVAWLTHGNQEFAGEIMTSGDTDALDDDYPAAAYQGSCLNAYPENSNNLSYSILKNGGITAVGATRTSFYYPGETEFAYSGSIGGLGYRYVGNLADDQSCGMALANARMEGSIIKANATRMTLYGDPSVVVFTDSTPKKLIGRWRLNESSGTVAWDTSGNRMHGELINRFIFNRAAVPGKGGNALDFNGINNYIELPEGFDSLGQGFTVTLWAYPTAVKDWARFIDFGNGEYNDNIIFGRRANSNDLFLEGYEGHSSGGQVIASGALELNKWQFFAAVVDSEGNAVIYKDGQVVASGTTVCPPDVLRRNNYIGKSNWSADDYYSGYMDDIRVFNYALSEEQINNIFDYRRKLVHHWKLDDPANWTTEGEHVISELLDSATGDYSGWVKTDDKPYALSAVGFQQPGAAPETGYSIKLGGRYEYIELGPVAPGADDFTMMLWFNMNSFRGRDEDDENYIISADNAQIGKWCVNLSEGSTSGETELRFRQDGYGDIRLMETVEDDSWYHLIMTRNSRGDFNIYINNDLVHSGVNNYEFTNASGGNGVWIGNRPADDAYYDGWVDDVRFYNYAVDSFPDLSDDGLTDTSDLRVFLEYWLAEDCGACAGADFNRDGVVNMEDLTEFSLYWLKNEYELYELE